MNLGGNIQYLRKQKKITQEQLAEKMNVSRQTVSRWESDEVTLELKDGCLTIQAVKGLDKDTSDKKGKYIRQERYAGACSRTFYVGENVMPEDIHASFENGILCLSVPKAAQKVLPRKTSIEIQ